MRKTAKKFRVNGVLMTSVFLLFSSAHAQPVLFSSDQWSKRWARAMNHQMSSVKLAHSSINKVSHQGWGQQPNEKRKTRSRTPDYKNGFYDRYESDALKRRYAVPESYSGSWPNSFGYEPYTRGRYYGNYPLMSPTIYPGTYPGLHQGMGAPVTGFPFSSPFLLAPGLTPGMGYPW